MTKNTSLLHTDRIRTELIAAGATRYTLLVGEARRLPDIIHKNEHIGGIVYGRTDNGPAMLVATDQRVIYVDSKLLYNRADEIGYDVVSGVSHNKQGRYSGIVLHTRLGDFKFKFVRSIMAGRFVRFIEKRQLETKPEPKADVPMPAFAVELSDTQVDFSQKARTFLISHDIGTLATVSDNGILQAAVVYYATDKQNNIYVVTKTKTNKALNIIKHPQVAFTAYDTSSMQTIQIEGIASVETDTKICKRIYDTILRPRFQGSHAEMPPIMYLPAGEYEVIVIKPMKYKFSDYKTQS